MFFLILHILFSLLGLVFLSEWLLSSWVDCLWVLVGVDGLLGVSYTEKSVTGYIDVPSIPG